jgi:hypothetical protein
MSEQGNSEENIGISIVEKLSSSSLTPSSSSEPVPPILASTVPATAQTSDDDDDDVSVLNGNEAYVDIKPDVQGNITVVNIELCSCGNQNSCFIM